MVNVVNFRADFPIADPETGIITPEFLRFLFDKDNGILEIDGNATTAQELAQAAQDAVDAINGTVFTAGTGLTGGGALGTDDPITFNWAADLGDLGDVDTTTTPPADGQALVWVDADSNWAPGDVASGGGGSLGPGETLILDQDWSSSQTTIDVTLSEAYDEIIIQWTDVAAGDSIYVMFSTDGGSTFLNAAADYTRGYISGSADGRLAGTAGEGLYLCNNGGDFYARIKHFKSSEYQTVVENYTMISASTVQSELTYLNSDDAHNLIRLWAPPSASMTGGNLRVIGRIYGGGGGGGGFTEVGDYDFSTDGAVANVDFTGLGSYAEFLIIGTGLTTSVSANIRVYVSVDNGSSFYTTSGDYQSLSSTDGTDGGNSSGLVFSGSNTTSARSIRFELKYNDGANLMGVNPIIDLGTQVVRRFTASSSIVDALRVAPTSGNITGGQFKVYAR